MPEPAGIRRPTMTFSFKPRNSSRLKENVIVGRLIPAGSGMAYHQARKVKDAMDDAERRAIAEAEAAELAGGSSDDEAVADEGTAGTTEA